MPHYCHTIWINLIFNSQIEAATRIYQTEKKIKKKSHTPWILAVILITASPSSASLESQFWKINFQSWESRDFPWLTFSNAKLGGWSFEECGFGGTRGLWTVRCANSFWGVACKISCWFNSNLKCAWKFQKYNLKSIWVNLDWPSDLSLQSGFDN